MNKAHSGNLNILMETLLASPAKALHVDMMATKDMTAKRF